MALRRDHALGRAARCAGGGTAPVAGACGAVLVGGGGGAARRRAGGGGHLPRAERRRGRAGGAQRAGRARRGGRVRRGGRWVASVRRRRAVPLLPSASSPGTVDHLSWSLPAGAACPAPVYYFSLAFDGGEAVARNGTASGGTVRGGGDCRDLKGEGRGIKDECRCRCVLKACRCRTRSRGLRMRRTCTR